MSDERLCWLPATTLSEMYRRKEVSPVEVVDAVLDRLERVNPGINAFVTVLADQAREAARRAQEQLANGTDDLPPLHGMPVTVKDLTNTAGVRTTYGSIAFTDHVPDEDSAAWARMKAAGAILIGKTTTPEFGMLGVTESRLTGITGNPWNPAMTAGGSSGGAAAATAAGIAPLAWGSDGGGSIRVPASCCGVAGLKASPGRIPRGGDDEPFDTVSTVGPLTRTVADTALLLSVTAGPDPREPLGLPPLQPSEIESALAEPTVRGLRVGYSPDLGWGPVARNVAASVEAAAQFFETGLGAHVGTVDISLPDPIQYFLDFWAPGFALGVGSFAAQPGWDPQQLHPMILELADVGRGITASEYLRTAHQTRAQIARGFAAVFEHHDLLLTPTTPTTAFPHNPDGGLSTIDGTAVPRWPGLNFHRLTEPPSHAALPAATICCGFTAEGLPVGLQIIGPPRADTAVLAAAAAYQAATDWHTRHPPLGNRPAEQGGNQPHDS
jgi:Asp-tRNA(Asn)/Glu-tRNA(Gln) amidotransferase A subunit family amidase